MGNKILRPSDMAKAQSEFDSCNYEKAIIILKEEMKYRPKSLEALRLLLKSHFKLYELEKADELYSKFFQIQKIEEDIQTKIVMVKEILWYDDAKARYLSKELSALVKSFQDKQTQSIVQLQSPNKVTGSVAHNNSQYYNNSNIRQNNSGIKNSNTLYVNMNTIPHKNSSIQENIVSFNQVDSNQYNEYISFAKALCLFIDCKYSESMRIIQQEIQMNPTASASIRLDSKILMILIFNKQKLFQSSLQLISDHQLVSVSKDKEFEIGILQSQIFILQGKYAECISKLKECSDLIPLNIFILYRLFSIFLKINDLKSARLSMEKANRVHIGESLVFMMQGDLYQAMRDQKSAAKMYQKGVTSIKQCFRCLEALGDVASDDNVRLQCYEKCLQVSPCYSDVMIKIGIYYLQCSDDYLEALRWFFKAVENKTTHKLTYYYIARSYYQNDQYPYALKNLAISLNLTYEKINDQLSLAVKIINKYGEFFKLKDIEEFIENIRFKYFQYFNTISQNIENVAFSKLYLPYVPMTQFSISYFALYKLILELNLVPSHDQKLSHSQRHISHQKDNILETELNLFPNKHDRTISLNHLSQSNHHHINPSPSPQLYSYFLKQTQIPLNKEAIQKAQKYYLDLMN